MLQLIGTSLAGLLLIALGIAFIFGARTFVELGRGKVYPPTQYKPHSAKERPIGCLSLLPIWWLGFTLVMVGLAVIVSPFLQSAPGDAV